MRFYLFIYLTIFGTYVLFTRQPDYFDGEYTNAIPVKKANNQFVLQFEVDKVPYEVAYETLFNKQPPRGKVKLIYEKANPQLAKPYKIWGYWIEWGELIFLLAGYLVLIQITNSINSNLSETAKAEQAAYLPTKKTKYD